MTEKNKIQKVPEGWAKEPFVKLCEIITDGTHKTPTYQETGVPFISTANLVPFRQFKFDKYTRFISPKEHKVLTNRCRPEKGDLLISKIGTLGLSKCIDVDYEFSIFVGLALAKLNKSIIIGKYLEQLLNTPRLQELMISLSPGSTRATLTIGAIGKINIFFPRSLSEQSKIAEILSTVDESIEKTDAKIEKLKRIKQGLMQDLFRYGIDKKGQMRTEKTHRFKDSPLGRIPEEWEFKELINAVQSCDDKRFPIKEEDRQKMSGNYPYYGASGVIDWINKYKFDGEFLLLAEDGENILSHNLPIAFIARGKFWVNNHVHVYKANEDMNILFLQAYLDSLDYAPFNTSSAQPKLTASTCSKLKLVKPSKSEQSRIASVLSAADEAIEKEEAYKNKLLAIKRGLMEDLLSGKVRVNKPMEKKDEN